MTVSILTSAIAVVLALTGQSIFSNRLPVIFLLATTLLFGIVEVCTVLLMSSKSSKDNTNRNINIFMVLKTGKLLLSLGLIFIYYESILDLLHRNLPYIYGCQYHIYAWLGEKQIG